MRLQRARLLLRVRSLSWLTSVLSTVFRSGRNSCCGEENPPKNKFINKQNQVEVSSRQAGKSSGGMGHTYHLHLRPHTAPHRVCFLQSPLNEAEAECNTEHRKLHKQGWHTLHCTCIISPWASVTFWPFLSLMFDSLTTPATLTPKSTTKALPFAVFAIPTGLMILSRATGGEDQGRSAPLGASARGAKGFQGVDGL